MLSITNFYFIFDERLFIIKRCFFTAKLTKVQKSDIKVIKSKKIPQTPETPLKICGITIRTLYIFKILNFW